MKLKFLKRLLFCLTGVLFFSLAACEDDETDLGGNLQDPASIYNGIYDTISGSELMAWTTFNDTLRTSGYTTGMIGTYHDATFGNVTAKIFTQLALSGNSGIRMSNYTIDSVMMTLVVDDIYPLDSCSAHLKISQLAETIRPDSAYRASSSVSVGSSHFDSVFTVSRTNNKLHFALDPSYHAVLHKDFDDQEAFNESVKGLCIELVNDQPDVILTLNFASTDCKMTIFYHDNDNNSGSSDILIGCSSAESTIIHFCQFKHTYNGTLAHQDSVAGGSKVYLEPLGGTFVWMNIDNFVNTFHQKHPQAIVHYAELLLPRAAEADTLCPERIVAYKMSSNRIPWPINDYSNTYTNSGYDGKYHKDSDYFRLRITQHLQSLITSGKDYGTVLEVFGPRSTARRTIINGPNDANGMRIVFVYTE